MKRILFSILLLSCLLMTKTSQAQNLVSFEFKTSLPLFFYQLVLGNEAKYGVEAYKITYTTTDIRGVLDTASGLITIPNTSAITSPLALVQHGTVSGRDDVPSNLMGGYELGAFLTSTGYVAIQPDYLGLGESRGFHPYVHADTEASAGIDMILAAKEFLEQRDVAFNEQLFVTGYSQGGHAAMAAHRELEANYSETLPVTAAAPMSGPYSISTATKESLLSDDEYLFPGYALWTLMSYNEAYSLYDSVAQYVKQPYATYAEAFYNEEIALDSLQRALIAELTATEGSSVVRFMFQDSIIDAVINRPNHPFNLALEDNDTFDWTPTSPTRLYYCMADDQVSFENSLLADSVMNANGAADLTSFDVMPTADHIGCVTPASLATLAFFKQFAIFSEITSTRDLVELEGVNAFPNPTSGSIQLTGIPQSANLQVFDMQGRIQKNVVLRQGTNDLDISGLSQGVYLFRVISDNGVWNRQIIRN
ncbi:MAG: T9SS type A sorting domain-containing protein [Bacteroidota bacterium]